MTMILPMAWDFHCHLDLFHNPIQAFEECRSKRLFTLSMTTTPKAWEQNILWAKGNDFVRVGLGLHPELIGQRKHETKEFISMLPNVKYVGEVGIDGSSQNRSSYASQCSFFEETVSEANRLGNKVINIHSRRAVTSVLKILEKVKKRDDVFYILHWFSGSKKQLLSAVELGCYFSINETMLKNENTSKILAIIPKERLLTETDEPFRTSLNEPRIEQLVRVVSKLSVLYNLKEENVRNIIYKNSLKFL